MRVYVIRRLVISIPTVIGVSMLIFLMLELAPGDPLVAILMPMKGVVAPQPGYMENLRRELGLDKPVHVRYMIWLVEVLKGNLGTSFTLSRPVADEILARLPATLELMLVATLFAILVGIPLGVLSAVKQYSLLDYILMWLSFSWVCIPGFFFGMIMIYVVSLQLKWLPAGGFGTPGAKFSLIDNLRHLILPAFVLGMSSLAEFVRYTRVSVLETLHQEYITAARAKGLSRTVVIFRHALRNALLPVLTRIGLTVPWIFSGSLIIENVFRWPGLGTLFMQSIVTRDYPLITGMSLIIALLVIASNLVTDLFYVIVDPRIRYD